MTSDGKLTGPHYGQDRVINPRFHLKNWLMFDDLEAAETEAKEIRDQGKWDVEVRELNPQAKRNQLGYKYGVFIREKTENGLEVINRNQEGFSGRAWLLKFDRPITTDPTLGEPVKTAYFVASRVNVQYREGV